MVKSLDEVIERLQYKADNIKAKLEPSYFTECIDYLKTLPRVQEEQEIRNKAIDEFAEKLKDSLAHNYRHFLNVDTDGFEWITTDAVDTHIQEIAKKMKGE